MARVLRRPRAAEDIAAVWDFIADDNPARVLFRLAENSKMIARGHRSRHLHIPFAVLQYINLQNRPMNAICNCLPELPTRQRPLTSR